MNDSFVEVSDPLESETAGTQGLGRIHLSLPQDALREESHVRLAEDDERWCLTGVLAFDPRQGKALNCGF